MAPRPLVHEGLQKEKVSQISPSLRGPVPEKESGRKPHRIVPVDGGPLAGNTSSSSEERDAAADLREKKLAAWDALVDRIAEMDDVTLETGKELKGALNELDPEDKLPAVNHALNLVPDKDFAAFVPVLFDKGQSEEILDTIFSDMLNRDESVKIPLMKELRKDKTHPMFFESARILDAIGEGR